MLSFVSSGARTYLSPIDEDTEAAVDSTFAILTKGGKAVQQTLRLRGREASLRVPLLVLPTLPDLAHMFHPSICHTPHLPHLPFLPADLTPILAPILAPIFDEQVHVPSAGVEAAVARFGFGDLCGKPLGAEDYLGLATAFHTIIVEKAPQLTLNEINQVSFPRACHTPDSTVYVTQPI